MKVKLEYEMVAKGACRVNVVGNDGVWYLFYADSNESICSDGEDWSDEDSDRARAIAQRAFDSASELEDSEETTEDSE